MLIPNNCYFNFSQLHHQFLCISLKTYCHLPPWNSDNSIQDVNSNNLTMHCLDFFQYTVSSSIVLHSFLLNKSFNKVNEKKNLNIKRRALSIPPWPSDADFKRKERGEGGGTRMACMNSDQKNSNVN